MAAKRPFLYVDLHQRPRGGFYYVPYQYFERIHVFSEIVFTTITDRSTPTFFFLAVVASGVVAVGHHLCDLVRNLRCAPDHTHKANALHTRVRPARAGLRFQREQAKTADEKV